MVNKERLIESFIHMVGIDSVSGKRRPVQRLSDG